LWSKMNTVQQISPLHVVEQNSKPSHTWLSEKASDDNDSNASPKGNVNLSDSAQVNNSGFVTFDCEEERCTKQFMRLGNLTIHMTTGKHDIEQKKYSLLDKSKLLYKQKLENVTLQAIPNLQNFKVIRSATNKQH
ncbi:unnamed protein product, partial [Didymodactylos carnosus]